jgi:hypothetical protein
VLCRAVTPFAPALPSYFRVGKHKTEFRTQRKSILTFKGAVGTLRYVRQGAHSRTQKKHILCHNPDIAATFISGLTQFDCFKRIYKEKV